MRIHTLVAMLLILITILFVALLDVLEVIDINQWMDSASRCICSTNF